MSRVLTKALLLLLYFGYVKNLPKEPFMLSIVRKMCTYRDAICKNEENTICSTRMVNNKVEFKNYDSTCYLFLGNICDQPGEEYHIISRGPCLNLNRRRNDEDTEVSNEIDDKNYKNNAKKKINARNDIPSDEIDDNANVDESNVVIDDDEEQFRGKHKHTNKSDDKETKDSDEVNNSSDSDNDDDNLEVTKIPKMTILDETREEHGRNDNKHTRNHLENVEMNDDVKIEDILSSLREDYEKEKKYNKIHESKKTTQATIKKNKATTKQHSHHKYDKDLDKHKSINNHHHHHHHHEKPTTEKIKSRSKRHSDHKSKPHSHNHAHSHSHTHTHSRTDPRTKNSLRENNEKVIESEAALSVNADVNEDKTFEEVGSRDDVDIGEKYNEETKGEEIINKSEVEMDAEEEHSDTENEGTTEVKKHTRSHSKTTKEIINKQASEMDLENELHEKDAYIKSSSFDEVTKSIERTAESKSNERSGLESNNSERKNKNIRNNSRRSSKHTKRHFHSHHTKTGIKHSSHERKPKRTKSKKSLRGGEEYISHEKLNDNKEIIKKIIEFEDLNKSGFISSDKVFNKTANAFLLIGENITIYEAGALYKPLTDNLSRNSTIIDKVNATNDTILNSITDIDISNVKNFIYNITDPLESYINITDKMHMKAHETDISTENNSHQNDKSSGENQSDENNSSNVNYTDNRGRTVIEEDDIIFDIIDNKDTATESMPSYDINANETFPDVNTNITEKFNHDIIGKLAELNITAANIGTYDETFADIARFNQLIDEIDVVDAEGPNRPRRIYDENFRDVIDTRGEVKRKPSMKIVEKRQAKDDRHLDQQNKDIVDLTQTKLHADLENEWKNIRKLLSV